MQSTSVRRVTPPYTCPRLRVGLLLACALVLLPLTASAAEEAADGVKSPAPDIAADRRAAREELEKELGTAAPEEGEGMGSMLLRTFVVLGVVVLSIYLTLNF